MAQVQAGDFYLTSTALPYEMRWQAREGDTFEVSICISPIRCLSPPMARVVIMIGRRRWRQALMIAPQRFRP